MGPFRGDQGMEKLRIGIIGCGRPWRTEGATGFGMGHAHAKGYKELPDCEIVACADIVRDNAYSFARSYGIPKVYTDYREMLEKEKPDIVSICTWPALHCEMVVASAESGVKAIHCEKPMAPTFGESKRMVRVCEEKGVQLTFNHQRRFLAPFRKAKELIKGGVIGELVRIEGECGNLFDWGTHWFDMFFFYNDETPAEWVMGQIDARKTKTVFGVKVEDQGISYFKFKNGVKAILFTGYDSSIGCANRIYGTEGVIEVGVPDGPHLRYRGKGDGDWKVVPTEEGIHGDVAIRRAIADLVEALKQGREPELSARKALQATEIIFATYESSRRRARIDLPLDIEDSPFLSMLESGEIGGDGR
jgi:predicted dehydrogenase